MRMDSAKVFGVCLSVFALIALVYACAKTAQPNREGSDASDFASKYRVGELKETEQPKTDFAFDLELMKAQLDWFNIVGMICVSYGHVTGKPPSSLAQMKNEGYLFCHPFNHLKNRPMLLENSREPGDFYIEKTPQGTFLSYDDGNELHQAALSESPKSRLAKAMEKHEYVKQYYSDPSHKKLLMLMETLGSAISLRKSDEVDTLFSEPAWPISTEGVNPVTGDSLKMGKGPGMYDIWFETKAGFRYVGYTVYDETGKSICNPFVTMRSKTENGKPAIGYKGMIKYQAAGPVDPLVQKQIDELKKEAEANSGS